MTDGKIPSLLSSAEDHFAQLRFDEAIQLYLEALSLDPENTSVMDSFSEALLQLNDHQRARQLILKSIQLKPETGFVKYMNLGQLLSGTDAVNAYKKGIQLIEQCIQQTRNQQELSDLKRQLVSGLTSIAEIYMTDLCLEPNAEQLCEHWTSKALNLDPNNWEALQTYGSLCISKQRTQDALTALKKCYETIQQLDSNDSHWPTREARINLGKLLIEVGDHQTASHLFETLIEEYESDPETWYLTGYCYTHFDLPSAHRCLETAKTLLNADTDPESYQSIVSLLEETNQKLTLSASTNTQQ